MNGKDKGKEEKKDKMLQKNRTWDLPKTVSLGVLSKWRVPGSIGDNYNICINYLELEALTLHPGLHSRFVLSAPSYSLCLTWLLFQSSGLPKLSQSVSVLTVPPSCMPLAAMCNLISKISLLFFVARLLMKKLNAVVLKNDNWRTLSISSIQL